MGRPSIVSAAIRPRQSRHRTIALMARVVAVALDAYRPPDPVPAYPDLFSEPIWFTDDRAVALIAQHDLTA